MARLSAGRRTALAAAALLLFYAALTAGAALRLGLTADERLLWKTGGAVVSGRFEVVETTFQGPLPLYANQLLASARGAPAGEDGPAFGDAERVRARLGLLPFGLLAGWLVFRRARVFFGDPGALIALATFALHPLMWGYGALVAVDMAHAALTLLALEAALVYAARPSLPRAACAGAALGLALATKYLALLVAPVCLLFTAAVAVRAARRRGGSAWRAGALTLVAAALAALVALHAAYGFRAGFAAEPAAYGSGALRGILGAPVLGQLAGLLPGPMLRGLDYQLQMGDAVVVTYFHGAYAAGHPLYYAVALSAKTPEAILLAWVVALLAGLARWLRGRASEPARDAALLFLAAALVPFLYLSLVTKLQVGIRYVLPLLPLLCIAAGSLPGLLARARAGPRLRRALAALYLLALFVPAVRAWPYGPGYFNALSGGSGRAHKLFNDSNADWGERREAGLARLTERHPGATEVQRGAGPRLGTLAVYVRFRTPRDPLHPARARHWLDALEPVDCEGAAWLVYEATPEGWRAAADRDPRARAELALALLGAGRLAEARAEIDALPAEARAPLEGLFALLEGGPPADDAAAVQLAGAWLFADRPDLTLAVLPPERAAASDAAALLRGQALVRLERVGEAIEALEARVRAPGDDPEGVLLLAELYRRTLRWEDGELLLERHLPSLSGGARQEAATALERLRTDRDRWQTFQHSLE